MKKRLRSLTLSLLLIPLVLSACGKPDTYTGIDPAPTKDEIPAITGGIDTGVSIPSSVLYDADGVKVTADSISFDAEDDPDTMTIALTVTGAKLSDLSLTGLAVNGYMIEAAGLDEDTSAITVTCGELSLYGISTITDLTLQLSVSGTEGDIVVISTGEDADTTLPDTYLAAIQTSSLTRSWGDQLMGLETGMDVSALDVSAQSAAILTDRWSDRVALVEVLNEDTVSHTVTMAGFGVNGVKITDASYTPQTMVLFPDCRAVFEVDPSSVVSDTAFSSLGISGDSIAAFSFDCTVDEDETTNGTLSFSAALSDAGMTTTDVIGIKALSENGLTLTAVSDPTPTDTLYFFAKNYTGKDLTFGPGITCSVGGKNISCTGSMELADEESGLFAVTTEDFNISDYILNNAADATEADFAAMDFVMPVTDENGNTEDLTFHIDYNSDENAVRIR